VAATREIKGSSSYSTRRSTRVRARIPVLITSPNANTPLSMKCETLVVSAHGGAIGVSQPLEAGMPLCLQIREGQQVTARVVLCQRIQGKQPSWIVAMELDKPGNIWGLTSPPEDWAPFDQKAEKPKTDAPSAHDRGLELKMPLWPLASPSARTGLSARAHEEIKTQLAAQQQRIASLEQQLAASMAAVPGVIRQQLAEIQQETLAQARKQFDAALAEALPQQSPAQGEAIARLEERMAGIESLPSQVRQQLSGAHEQIQAQIRLQVGASLAESLKPMREELAASRKKAEEIEQIRAMVAERLAQLPPYIQEHSAESLKPMREELAACRKKAEEIEQIRAMVAEHLAQLPRYIQEHSAESLKLMREELAACRKKAEETEQIRAMVAEHLAQLPRYVQEHSTGFLEAFQEQARAELEGVLAEAKSRDQQAVARWQALEPATQAVENELKQARELLESSTRNLSQRIQEPVAAAVQEALARARAEILADAGELESLRERGRTAVEELRRAADSLRNEREAATARLLAVETSQREELQLWLSQQQALLAEQVKRQLAQLSEQQSALTDELGHKLEQLASELAARAARTLDEQIRSGAEQQVERAHADLRAQLAPLLERAAGLRQEVPSLLEALQKENERCQVQVRAMREHEQSVDGWIKERTTEFQKMLHDALVETTGQIRGRLQMAGEMLEAPLERLREQAAQQLQEQAGRQTRHLREYADEIVEHLRGLQRETGTAMRESLRVQAAETAATCGREIAEIAERSVQEWRSALAKNLEDITSVLNQRLPPEPH